VSELYQPSDRRLSAKLVPTFADWGCRVVSPKDPYGSILDFLDKSRYFFFSSSSSIVLTRLSGPCSRSSPCPFRKSGCIRNRTRTSGSTARNFAH
jgi:hypothetical protein